MRRYAYTIPLVLLALTAIVWVRTGWYDEYVHYQWTDARDRWWDVISIGSASGKMLIGRSRTVIPYTFSDGFNYRRYDRAARETADRGPLVGFLGFQYWPRDYDHDTGWLVVPYGFIACVLALFIGAAWLWGFPACRRRCRGFAVALSRAVSS